ncbi:proteasome assembly chaperone family protein [Halorussus halophilus]|uniref:proteasome assembly chaperone family protein n=1 Tax=Halorussus halophilus TaxID=2650975 RepID=UPI001300DAB7|nr:PAC2 family protein [Halorussus halophilus]
MAHVETHADVELDEPTLLEGMPGIGLVGKIATDHVISELEMVYFGSLHCPGLPQVAVYDSGSSNLYPPVRLYASEEHDLVVLRSDVAVSPTEVSEFATCVSGWIEEQQALPIYVSGLPTDVSGTEDRALYGVATGDAEERLAGHDIEPPATDGVWSGPTGALLGRAGEVDMDAVGLIVESDPQFPDPEAACVYINRAINPIAGVEIDDSGLRERAEEIRQEKQQFAQQMGQNNDDSSRVEARGMYQ